METLDLIQSAASILESASKIDDEESKEALNTAARALMQSALSQMSVTVTEEDD